MGIEESHFDLRARIINSLGLYLLSFYGEIRRQHKMVFISLVDYNEECC